MNEKIVKVLEGQTLWDIALQEYGQVEAVWLLLEDNPEVDMDTALFSGQELVIRKELPELEASGAILEGSDEAEMLKLFVKSFDISKLIVPIVDNLSNGTVNQYLRGDKLWADFDTSARQAISSDITAIIYNPGSGKLSLHQDYTIPTLVKAAQWDAVYNWYNSNPLNGYATQAWVTSQGYALASSLGTMAFQAKINVDIDGGEIDATSIGLTSRASGRFSTLGVGISSGLLASLHVVGTGATNSTSTFPFWLQNATVTQPSGNRTTIVNVSDAGFWTFNQLSDAATNTNTILDVDRGWTTASNFFRARKGSDIFFNVGLNGVAITYNSASISATYSPFTIGGTYNPTSGDGAYNSLTISTIFNQTGTANGPVRAIFINPNFQSAPNARAIEIAMGNNAGHALRVTGINSLIYTAGHVTLDGLLSLGRFTTTQRDGLSVVNSHIIYNNTTNKFQGRAGGAWVDFH